MNKSWGLFLCEMYQIIMESYAACEFVESDVKTQNPMWDVHKRSWPLDPRHVAQDVIFPAIRCESRG